MISVAIVTARRTEHTHWRPWQRYIRAFLRGDWADPLVTGEWGAILAALNQRLGMRHQTIQLYGLEQQTVQPDQVVFVERDQMSSTPRTTLQGWPFRVNVYAAESKGPVPQGNADKNQAIDLCTSPAMIMLDDCCIPSFAFVEIACEVCARGNILLPGHWKVHLPTDAGGKCAVSRANEAADTEGVGRRVGGIWAMPTSIAAEVRYNEALDGKHGLWDQEFLQRLDEYAALHGVKYERHRCARVYEIEHDRPWLDAGNHDANLLSQPDWEDRVRAEKKESAPEAP